MTDDDTTSSAELASIRRRLAMVRVKGPAGDLIAGPELGAWVDHLAAEVARIVATAKGAALREASDAFVAQQQALARTEGRVAPWGEAAAFLDLRADEIEEAGRG